MEADGTPFTPIWWKASALTTAPPLLPIEYLAASRIL